MHIDQFGYFSTEIPSRNQINVTNVNICFSTVSEYFVFFSLFCPCVSGTVIANLTQMQARNEKTHTHTKSNKKDRHRITFPIFFLLYHITSFFMYKSTHTHTAPIEDIGNNIFIFKFGQKRLIKSKYTYNTQQYMQCLHVYTMRMNTICTYTMNIHRTHIYEYKHVNKLK